MPINKASKIAVLIHGYPGPIYKDHPLYKYFNERGYSIISLYLFSSDFKLTQEEVKTYIGKELGGREPDVIVGVSLGGLLAPYLAKGFPKAKLVLIATGPYIRTKITTLNRLLTFEETSALLSPVQWIIIHTPVWLYSIIYKLFIHPVTNPEERRLLEEHIKQNWGYLKDIPLSENKEVLDFLASTDNSVLLRSLKNETVIFTGNGDNLMPSDLSLKMKKLIKRSFLVKSEKRLHYVIFNEDNYGQLDNFLDNSSASTEASRLW